MDWEYPAASYICRYINTCRDMIHNLKRAFHNPLQMIAMGMWSTAQNHSENFFFLPKSWRQINKILWPKYERAGAKFSITHIYFHPWEQIPLL